MGEHTERGILIDGDVLAGTDWCLRHPDAWWARGEFGTRPRAARVDLLGGHWTAGEAGRRRYDDDGPFVVRVMKKRLSRKRPGQRLRVSVQFVIGACAPDAEFANVWQTMDLAHDAATHVGMGRINARSIGVEVVNAGLPGRTDIRKRPQTTLEVLGRHRTVLDFFGGQFRSWVRLANALSAACMPSGIEIPRRVPVEEGEPLARRFTRGELRRWTGAMEHLHMPNTTKLDAATLLIGALLDDGWDPIEL